jgi:hypothetical protein
LFCRGRIRIVNEKSVNKYSINTGSQARSRRHRYLLRRVFQDAAAH